MITQTYTQIEIILVNDGSTDNSKKICEIWEKADSRIKLINQGNKGLSAARNIGIRKSTGEYITCVDSDDYIEQSYVDVLYSGIKKTNSDISMVKHYTRYPSRTIDMSTHKEYILSPEECIKMMLEQNDVDTSAWGKLYKRTLFDNIKYPEGRDFEDIATTYKLFMRANKIFFNSVPLYNYMIRKNSISTAAFSERNYDLIEMTKKACKDIAKGYPTLDDACNSRLIHAYLSTMRAYALANKRKNKSLIIELKKLCRNTRNRKISKQEKIILPIAIYNYRLFMFICRIREKSLCK